MKAFWIGLWVFTLIVNRAVESQLMIITAMHSAANDLLGSK